MTATSHSKVYVKRGKVIASITSRDDIECRRVIKDMIVKSEITAKTRCYKLQFGQILVFLSYIIPRDVVNTTGFKVSPVVFFDLRSSLGKLFCRDFSSPVGLDGLLDLTVCTLISKSDIKVDICA